MKRKLIAIAVATALTTATSLISAQQGKMSDDVVKIGVLTDMSGVYADYGGPGAVTAAKMAIEDFGGKMFGKNIEIVNADHQNKPDIAKSVTQQWFDRDKVDMTVENLNSSVALAVQALGKEKNKITIVTGAASSRMTNEDCAPDDTGIHYLMDTIALSNVVGKAIVKDGGNSWFFLTADYAFGHSLEKDTGEVVKAAGGKVMGAVRHPLSTGDFSSFLLQAQSSGAKVVGLANAGGDTVNSIKAASEFGLTKKQNLAALLMLISDVHAVGLNTAQGLYLTEGWYWNMNDESRKWASRFEATMKRKPNSNHASVYSSTLHYLNAVKAAGTDDTAAVMKKMRETPINDMFAKGGKLREDGRMVHDMYLFQVKTPAESKGPWDYYNLKGTVKGEDAFQSIAAGKCAAAKK